MERVMKRMKRVMIGIAVVLLLAFAGCVTTGPGTVPMNIPLPSDLRIVSPGPDIPTELKGFSGEWFGMWGGQLPHILVVEQIKKVGDEFQATIVYAWGAGPKYSPGYDMSPDYRRMEGKFDGNTLVIIRGGIMVTYNPLPNGCLKAEYNATRGYAAAVMSRMENVK